MPTVAGPENMTSYKDLHEQFVSGHNGTSLFEVSLIVSFPAASVLVRDLICLVFVHSKQPWLLFLINFCVVFMPVVLGTTVLSFMNITIFISLCTIAGGTLFHIVQNVSKDRRNCSSLMEFKMGMWRPFVSYFRANCLIGTCLAILAVDFAVFPRRLAKAETYGTGGMDMGVGYFVVVNAIVSPEARGKSQTKSAVLQAVKSSFPLLVLGVVRVLAVKGLDYHEHVSEYGVHWNFFLTLAVVKIFSSVIFSLFPAWLSGFLAVAVAVSYQTCLSSFGLTNYILYGSDGRGGRHGLLDANREGIFSCIGYLAIYLAGVQIGRYIFIKRETMQQWVQTFSMLVVTSTVSWILLFVVQRSVEPISRRIANGPFVLWMVAFNTQVLALFLLGDILFTCARYLYSEEFKDEEVQETCLFSAINYNSLLFFLLSNVLTGIVNMSMQTIFVNSTTAVSIILLYTFLLSLTITVLHRKKISTKFW